MERLTLICKPTHSCNLNCTYCYEEYNRKTNFDKWDFNTVDRIAYLIGNSHNEITFNWHGGECLTMGAEWITCATKQISDVAKSINPKLNINFNLQSNGILLTKETAKLLEEYNIVPALSYDGLFQYMRCNSQITNEIIKTNLQYLVDKNNNTSIISVVTKENSNHLIESYNYFKQIGLKSISFNNVFPKDICGEDMRDINHFIQDWKNFFNYWFWDISGIAERTCKDMLYSLFNRMDNIVCHHTNCIGHFLTIDSNGNIYPCDSGFDRFGNKYVLANIWDTDINSFYDVFKTNNFIAYQKEYSKRMLKCATECDYYAQCRGGCPANILSTKGSVLLYDDNYCKFMKQMLDYIYEVIKNLSINDMLKINPEAYTVLAECGYLPLDKIKEAIIEVGGNLEWVTD